MSSRLLASIPSVGNVDLRLVLLSSQEIGQFCGIISQEATVRNRKLSTDRSHRRPAETPTH
jgi:hypothetical protein